jgi:hypothetical protein
MEIALPRNVSINRRADGELHYIKTLGDAYHPRTGEHVGIHAISLGKVDGMSQEELVRRAALPPHFW